MIDEMSTLYRISQDRWNVVWYLDGDGGDVVMKDEWDDESLGWRRRRRDFPWVCVASPS